MPASRLLILFFAFAALILMPSKVLAQGTTPGDPESEGRGTVFPGRAPVTEPRGSSESPIKSSDDSNLTPIERVDAAIQARAKSGADRIPNCRYGPVERRIPDERLRYLAQQFQNVSGDEAWALLQQEPDDPNSAPISIAIPSENGPNCPERDIDEVLLEERQQLLDDEWETGVATPPNPTADAPTSQPTPRRPIRPPEEIHPHPVQVLNYGDLTEIERIEAISRSRAARGWDHLPDCYYGPIQVRIPLARVNSLLKLPGLSGEEYWALLNAELQDPKLDSLTIVVRSGKQPDCPAGNIDERLRQERQRLLEEQTSQ